MDPSIIPALAGVIGATTPFAIKLTDTLKFIYAQESEPRLIKSRGLAEVEVNKAQHDEDLRYRRAELRVARLEDRRQRNIESIIDKTLPYAPEKISPEKVDEDWTVNFLNHCQDVCNEEMQHLWAKILAGEVAKPGSFSKQTVQIVQLLSNWDARLFQMVSLVSIRMGRRFIIQDKILDDYFNEASISFVNLLSLHDLGLLCDVSSQSTGLPEGSSGLMVHYCGGQFPIFNHSEKTLFVTGTFFTKAGVELFPLCEGSADPEFVKLLKQSFVRYGYDLVTNGKDGCITG
ncbi:MAG: DUF2806 domain-containing protein [Anaerolineaceae bacterium]|nr:DUF2806 domain-containing protein [Anaerolineaceae bacterium]MDD5367501.1 DUF2806 domain-containing protein [Anaerolineaceae bacterium]